MKCWRAVVVLVFAVMLWVPTPAPTQQYTPAESLSKEALDKLADLQSAAQQLAEQQGQFAGRSVGPQFASATGQMLQVLLNFDVWACGSAITALHLKRERLAVAAAGEMPPDPKLDKAVDDFGRLISQLQELCDRYVYRTYGANPGGAGAPGVAPPPVVEPPPPPPRLSPQEQICYNRCHELYDQYLRAESEYDRARTEAERQAQTAASLRQEAGRAAERARAASQQAQDTQREFDRLQAAMTAAKSQAERLGIAGQLAHANPQSARQFADQAQRSADKAAQDAQQAEERAARSATEASALYDAMLEIYRAWERCARNCAEQARAYDHVDVDWHNLFPGMPGSEPPRPPFYRPMAAAPVGGSVGLAPDDKRILEIHNSERAVVGAPPLRWNETLARHAQDYANVLARTGQLVHAPREGRGGERENLQKAGMGWPPDRLMNDWVSEKRYFHAGIFPAVCDGGWARCAHYTQMIWPTTTDLGCARVRGRGFDWFVCRYSPGGNRDGEMVGTGASVRPRLIGGDYGGAQPASKPSREHPVSQPPRVPR